MISLIALLLLPGQDEVELARKMTTGEKLDYEVRSNLMAEIKAGDMSFFLPQEFDVNYKFSMTFENARPDGFATVLYERPSMTLIDGETAERPPKQTVEKIGWKLRLTLSPINELTDVKDLSEKKKDGKDGKDGKGGNGQLRAVGRLPRSVQDGGIGRMIQELNSLAMFVGNLDSSLDFSPKLPFDSVQPGATWKKTVSYQPREIKGTDKQAVQRLDYVYTYEGLADSGGKKVHRVTAKLDLDTDAAKFINQSMGTKPEESGLKELRLRMKALLTFDLDKDSKATLRAEGASEGGFAIVTTDRDEPVYQEKIKGHTTLRLLEKK
ncbi:MAG: hypothetical protein JST30_08135 [Armatimonadetes bacterium]|nr:hypothetical protein [Armatimonadota bacterium]